MRHGRRVKTKAMSVCGSVNVGDLRVLAPCARVFSSARRLGSWKQRLVGETMRPHEQSKRREEGERGGCLVDASVLALSVRLSVRPSTYTRCFFGTSQEFPACAPE